MCNAKSQNCQSSSPTIWIPFHNQNAVFPHLPIHHQSWSVWSEVDLLNRMTRRKCQRTKPKKVTIKFKAIQTEVTAILNNLNSAITHTPNSDILSLISLNAFTIHLATEARSENSFPHLFTLSWVNSNWQVTSTLGQLTTKLYETPDPCGPRRPPYPQTRGSSPWRKTLGWASILWQCVVSQCQRKQLSHPVKR